MFITIVVYNSKIKYLSEYAWIIADQL